MDRSSPKMPKFQYDHLDATSQEIRLIRASPSGLGSEKDEIQLTMRTVSLINPPPFIALSYAWGIPQLSHPVICNQQRLLVTDNLARALRTVFRSMKSSDSPMHSEGENIELWDPYIPKLG